MHSWCVRFSALKCTMKQSNLHLRCLSIRTSFVTNYNLGSTDFNKLDPVYYHTGLAETRKDSSKQCKSIIGILSPAAGLRTAISRAQNECWPLAVARRLTRFWAISIHFPSPQLMSLRYITTRGWTSRRPVGTTSRVHTLVLSHPLSEICTIHTHRNMKSLKHVCTHAHARKIYVNICARFLGVLTPFCTVWKITPANTTWSRVCFV